MKKLSEYKAVMFDYVGTLCEEPKGEKPTMFEMLFKIDFKKFKPNKVIYNLASNMTKQKVYVVGFVDTFVEAAQKEVWLGKHFPNIKKPNIFFVSGKHQKSEVVAAIMKKCDYKASDVLFVDDREKNRIDVATLGVDVVHPNDLQAMQ